jgi:phosphatidate phosphatase APP1
MKRPRVTSTALIAMLAAGCAAPRIRTFDALARPGEEVVLTARLETDGLPGLSPDYENETLVLTAPGGAEQAAVTGDEGTAEFRVRAPDRRGDFTCSVRDGGSTERALLRLAVRPAEEPLLLVDLDGTIVASGTFAVIRGEAEPMPGAAEALTALSRGRTIVYFTARDDFLLRSTREFLSRYRFPPAPLLLRDLTIGTLSAETYKTEALRALRERFTGPWVGVGDRVEDARAYLANGARALILSVDPEDLPPGAIAVRDWAEIRALLSKPE